MCASSNPDSTPSPPTHGHRIHTHFYVCIYQDRSVEAPPNPQNGNSKQHWSYVWAVEVEPLEHHRFHIRVHHHHDHAAPKPILFYIRRNGVSSSWACHSRVPDAEDQKYLVGKILVGESKVFAAPALVEELLRTRRLPELEEEDGVTEKESDGWIRKAILVLQEEGLIEAFDLDELVTFAKRYVEARVISKRQGEEDAVPAAVRYDKAPSLVPV